MEATLVLNRESALASRIRAWPARMMGVLALASVLFFARLGERALWSEEVRWGQIPREMVQSGNFLWPTINGRTYYDKPLGSYWLVLLASWLTGGIDETSARLPSALAGILAVAFAMLIARRLFDDDTAIYSGVILATSFSFVFFSRTASTDVGTIAGVLAALWIFLRNEAKPGGWWTLLLWLVMALTSLTKGLLGFVLPIMIIGLYSTFASPIRPATNSLRAWLAALVDRNRWLFNRMTLLAMPLGAAVYLGPFLLSMAPEGSTAGLEMVYRENIRRFFDPVNHRGPIYLYGYVIFLLLAPWSLLLPAALAHAVRSSDKERRGRVFILAYFWGTFVFFTLSASRRSYYLLPILPAAAFLIARLLAEREALGRWTRHLLLAGFFLFGSLVIVSVVALLPTTWLLPAPWNRLPALPCPWLFASAWLLSIVGLGWACADLRPRRIGKCWIVIAVAFMGYYYLGALPAVEVYRTQRPFAEAVQARLGPRTADAALFRTREIVYYLGQPGPLAEYHTPNNLWQAMQTKGVRWLIVRRRDWQSLNLPGAELLAEIVHPWESASDAENKLLLVEIDARDRAAQFGHCGAFAGSVKYLDGKARPRDPKRSQAMLQDEIQEQMQTLVKQVEELRAEVETLKEKSTDEPTLIPGAEYDFVPSVPEKVIGTFKLRVRNVVREDSTLCLSDEEWQMYSTKDET